MDGKYSVDAIPNMPVTASTAAMRPMTPRTRVVVRAGIIERSIASLHGRMENGAVGTILRAMYPTRALRSRNLAVMILLLGAFALFAGRWYFFGQDKSDFPDGYDAGQVAPKSHRILFENAFVRVLEVTVPPGTKEPIHHHRWPSLFLVWDTGGRTAHLRYYLADGSVRDHPSTDRPLLEGK